MNSANRRMELLQEERRFVSQAKSGDVGAFVQLYDAYVERVYRYVYFLVADDTAAETITSRVFIQAWESIKRQRAFFTPFVVGLYKIARNQIAEYYKSHQKKVIPDDGFALAARRDTWDHDFQSIFDPQSVRDTLQLLSEEQQHILVSKFTAAMPVEKIARMMGKRESAIRDLEMQAFQVLGELNARNEINMTEFQEILEDCLPKVLAGTASVEECLARYPEHARDLRPLLRTVYSLNLAGVLKPAQAMNARTRSNIIQYLRFHRRQPSHTPLMLRAAFAMVFLAIAFLVTGTARAQAAVPGDAFYGWKRASEVVWRAVSIDPIGTDIVLANRRLDEWMSLKNDPQHNSEALVGYVEVISRLKSDHNSQTLARLMPVIQSHQEILDDAGYDGSELESYVSSELETIPVIVVTQVAPTTVPTATVAATAVVEPTLPPTEIPPTEIPPTEIPPTEIPPTEIPPTEIPPTEIPPTPESLAPNGAGLSNTHLPLELPVP